MRGQEKKEQVRREGPVEYTKEELEDKCKAYFALCDDDGKKYTKPGLILYLNLPEDTFDGWLRDEEGNYAALSGVLKKAMIRMRDDLEQRNDTMSLFRLKQPCYGGYSDRPTEDKGQGIRVSVRFGQGDGKAAVMYGK